MEKVGQQYAVNDGLLQTRKEKSCLISVVRQLISVCGIDVRGPVLAIGGGQEDQEILGACGFEQIHLSNLGPDGTGLDAENIALPSDSYPVVFAHAVLHHCRCPQKALGEMVRVSQKHALFLEPNDSWALRMLVRFGYSFPYELAAVAGNGYSRGGMRNGPIPNYIYRWTEEAVRACIFAYHPERQFEIRAHPYWDFYVAEEDLLFRKESKVASMAERVGPRTLISILHFAQDLLNVVPPFRSQGNKFFCAISKGALQPWMEDRDGQYFMKRRA
ncbi:MAG TPA: methyltransferase domain-containing protein [Candidatus Eisenbacteria bacterium]|nr:methyltransferase domain-containing protein [Candidatus Eisenbacteria bacterium]